MKWTKANRKLLAGVLAGALLVTGGITTMSAQAAQRDGNQPRVERQCPAGGPQRQMDSSEMAKHISEQFGVSESEVKDALDAKTDFRNIGRAAMLAKISNKSFSDVLGMKTDSNSWRDVADSLGVTRDQIRSERQSMTADRIAAKGTIEKDAALSLLENGYQPRDIEKAALLAKESGKDVQSVLDLKKINNRWSDVAEQLGVSKDVLHQDRDGHKGFRGDRRGPAGPDQPCFGGPEGAPDDGRQAPTDSQSEK